MQGNIFYFNWEVQLLQFLQTFDSAFVTSLATFFTMLGEDMFVVALLGFCYWCIDKELGYRLSLCMMGGAMFGTLIKSCFLRRRPYFDHSEIKCLRPANAGKDIMNPVEQGFSLPSLHATMSVATYGSIHLFFRKKWSLILAIGLPLCIGLSRNYLGVHYPTDVLVGWVLGIISLFLLTAIYEKYGYKKAFLVVLVIGALGFIICRDNEFFSCYGIVIGLLLGFIAEEKYVNFEKPTKWWCYILRTVLGVGIYLGLNVLLKMPISGMVADKDNLFLLFYRLGRYSISVFAIMGLYPMLFRKLKI